MEYTVTPETGRILTEVMMILDDFDHIQYEGFSKEEIEIYEKLNERRNQNIRRGVK